MRSASRDSWITLAGAVGVGVGAVLFWQVVSDVVNVIPSPAVSVRAMIASYTSGDLTPALRATLENAGLAFAAAFVIGTVLAILIGRSEYWYAVLNPMIVAGNGVPKIILYPLILLTFKLTPQAVIVMGFIHGLFPVLINVTAATRDLKPVYVKVGRSLNVGTWRMMTKIYIPAIFLPLIVSVRLCFDLSILGVIIAELFAAKLGMGLLIRQDYNLGEFGDMMGVILVLCFVALAGSLIAWGIERRVRRYAWGPE